MTFKTAEANNIKNATGVIFNRILYLGGYDISTEIQRFFKEKEAKQMGRTLKDRFGSTLPTDRKNRNRRLIFCGFCAIIGMRVYEKTKVREEK